MAAKFFLVLCASALFVQSAVSQCGCGGYSAANILPTYGNIGCGAGYGNAGLGNIVSSGVATSSGGAFPTSSHSAIAPSSIAVQSNNNIEGALAVEGQLPFLSAVAFEGQLPSSGAAGVSYSCGDNVVGITSESLAAAGVGAANAAGVANGLGLASAGYGTLGLANNGLGLANNGIGFGNIGGLRLGGHSCGCGY